MGYDWMNFDFLSLVMRLVFVLLLAMCCVSHANSIYMWQGSNKLQAKILQDGTACNIETDTIVSQDVEKHGQPCPIELSNDVSTGRGTISISEKDGRKVLVVAKSSPQQTKDLSDDELNKAIEGLLTSRDNLKPIQTSLMNTEPFFVNSDTLNVRDAPNGTVIDKLNRGQTVWVYESSDDKKWVRISQNKAQWVWFNSLCDSVSCYIKNDVDDTDDFDETWYTTTRTQSQSKSKIKKTSKKQKSTTSHTYSPLSYGGGSCPCSSSYSCVGPRGGKYCYTSGGNKRYR